MQETHIAQPPKAHWYDGLTPTHWRVLRNVGFLHDGVS